MAERDFNLEMTGEQVKDALQQLEDRVAEGWAVGAKDGTPVTSGSPYYENNAKYYAGQAENAATRAESAVPAGVDSAVLFTQEQQLTTDQQEQARQNIKAGGSNPNLFDNPWFTVNQRGATSGTGSSSVVYVSDRWSAQFADYTINSDKSITLTTTDSNYGINQHVPYEQLKLGETYTISANINGSIKSVTFTLAPGYQAYFDGTNVRPFIAVNSTNYWEVWIISYQSGATFTLSAIKLEKGSVSTLANDAPPNYAEELAKCQRYFIRLAGSYGPIGIGAVVSTTIATCMLPLPVPMRAAPTVTLTGTLYTNGRAAIAVQSFTTAPPSGSAIGMNITSTGALTIGEAVLLQFRDANSHLDLSADL